MSANSLHCAWFFLLLSGSSYAQIRHIDLSDTDVIPGRYLVELKQPSLGTPSIRSFHDRKKQIHEEQNGVIDAISKFHSGQIGTRSNERIQIPQRFDVALNGFSIQIPRTEKDADYLSLIKQHPDVSRVTPVTRVKIPESLQEINADQPDPIPVTMLPPLQIPEVWKKTGLTGKGIRIAIIDTGIDYTHPDLGGCFGLGCKVAGGYDFVNKDADPRDDNAHGTHVAGIAAGNGRKKGVAPDATLYAYKVLSGNGYGTVDTIIAAIERAIDPNSDGDMSDSAHVLNLSLGGSEDEDSPMSRAVDVASRFSQVVCAAGNSGTSNAVGSPGAAREAITVAATDDQGKRAQFSSVGPTAQFLLKPDIAAPGVSIWSTALNGSYLAFSGTSMATPYVAGLLALLAEQSPEILSTSKDLLKRTASPADPNTGGSDSMKKSTSSYFYVGHGEVNPIHLLSNALPDLLPHFQGTPENSTQLGAHVGISELSRTVVIPVRLRSATAKTYQIAVQSDLGPEVKIDYLPKVAKLEEGQNEKWINITVTVSAASATAVALNPTYPFDHGLIVQVTDETLKESVNIPVTLFLKAHYRLEWDADIPFLRPGAFRQDHLQFVGGWSEVAGTPNRRVFDALIEPGRYGEFLHSSLSGKEWYVWMASDVEVTQTGVHRAIEKSDLSRKTKLEFQNLDGLPYLPENAIMQFVSPSLYSEGSLSKNRAGYSYGFSMDPKITRSFPTFYANDAREWQWSVASIDFRGSQTVISGVNLSDPLNFKENIKVPESTQSFRKLSLTPMNASTSPLNLCQNSYFHPSPYRDFGSGFSHKASPPFSELIYSGPDALSPLSFHVFQCPNPSRSLTFRFDEAGIFSADRRGRPSVSLGESIHSGAALDLLGVTFSIFKLNSQEMTLSMVVGGRFNQDGERGSGPASYRVTHIEDGKLKEGSVTKQSAENFDGLVPGHHLNAIVTDASLDSAAWTQKLESSFTVPSFATFSTPPMREHIPLSLGGFRWVFDASAKSMRLQVAIEGGRNTDLGQSAITDIGLHIIDRASNTVVMDVPMRRHTNEFVGSARFEKDPQEYELEITARSRYGDTLRYRNRRPFFSESSR